MLSQLDSEKSVQGEMCRLNQEIYGHCFRATGAMSTDNYGLYGIVLSWSMQENRGNVPKRYWKRKTNFKTSWISVQVNPFRISSSQTSISPTAAKLSLNTDRKTTWEPNSQFHDHASLSYQSVYLVDKCMIRTGSVYHVTAHWTTEFLQPVHRNLCVHHVKHSITPI